MFVIVQVDKNSRQFQLRTTDQKQITVVLSEPLGEYLDGVIQIRGRFDGQRIQAHSYNVLLPDVAADFG